MKSDVRLINDFRGYSYISNLSSYTEEELKRVLWLAACGKFHLPKCLCNDIDAELLRKFKTTNGYCCICCHPVENCECEAPHAD